MSSLSSELEKLIWKISVKNRLKYDKLDFKSVVGKLVHERPEIKKDLRSIISEIKKIVDKVSSLSLEDVQELAEKYSVVLEEEKSSSEIEFPPLEKVTKGKIVTAFPPEPSKYPHLGHAKAAFVNYYYARKYDGTFILRFEDSNPEKAKDEYYQAFVEDLKWLGIEWDKIDYLSDHIEEYYKLTEKLLKEGKAYVCTCSKEKISEYRREGKECEHRNQSIEKNFELWRKMLSGEIEEGKAIIRLKIDMNHKNSVMRDPAIMRISKAEHPRLGRKYFVWPLYDFGTALLDAWEGITHRFRSKEFEMRDELQNYIREICGFSNHPKITEMARFEIKGFLTSGRKIRKLIQDGVVGGWDDPRLLTIRALRRRGFLPEAIKDFLKRTGLSKAEGKLEFEVLATVNRQHLDPAANRYFAVFNPVELDVVDVKEKVAKINYHPDHQERGYREIITKGKFFISREDAEKLNVGDVIRLVDVYNIEVVEKSDNKIKAKYHNDEIVKSMKKIQWVSRDDDYVEVKLIVPGLLLDENGEINENSLEIKSGLGESHIKNLKIGERIQLLRIGFAKVEKTNPEIEFLFIHK